MITYPRFMWAFLLACMLTSLSSATLAIQVEIEDPVFDGTSATITNPYWPLSTAGGAYGYRAVTEDGCEFNKLVVTSSTRMVEVEDGVFVETRVIRDQAWETELDDDDNCDLTTAELLEDTEDYLAQDVDGNIWYFGEGTFAKEVEDGACEIVTDGSWEAGQPQDDPEVDPAIAGVLMLANPKSGDRYLQEFLADEAEDQAAVLRLNGRVMIDAGNYSDCLITYEWTPLDRGANEHKYYCLTAEEGTTPGLVYIRELKGKTVNVEYVGDAFPAGLPGDNSLEFPSNELSCD